MRSVKELTGYLKEYGFRKTAKQIVYKSLNIEEKRYEAWRKANCPDESQLKAQSQMTWEYMPLISIVVPVYMPNELYLEDMVNSVLSQSYGNWELCLSEGSGSEYCRPLGDEEDSCYGEFLAMINDKDPRIRIVYSEEPLKIADNTNLAISIATGDYVAFMDDDDLLSPDALYECVKAINKYPETDIIYSDEDKVDSEGSRFFEPHFKTAYNPELICSVNYFCHLVVIRKAVVDYVGYLDNTMDGAQDYDYVLRTLEFTSAVHHIPKILYHWRTHRSSTAMNPESKRYAYEAGKRALSAHYDRVGIPADVERGSLPGLYRTMHRWDELPMISIIIPNKDHTDDLERCISSILNKCIYPKFEILIIENNSTEPGTYDYYRTLAKRDSRIRLLKYQGGFNFSAINNMAVENARGDYFLFLNNDTEMIDHGSIEEMLGYCMRDGVGAVGARLYYPDKTIQHAGVVLGFGGFAGHAFIGKPSVDPGYFARIWEAQNYLAVTAACMMVKRNAFMKVGGFDETFEVALNDVDLCLRMWQAGYRVVYTPYAEFYHYESQSRGYEDTADKKSRFDSEIRRFKERYQEFLDMGDPFYSPNLSLERCDFTVGA